MCCCEFGVNGPLSVSPIEGKLEELIKGQILNVGCNTGSQGCTQQSWILDCKTTQSKKGKKNKVVIIADLGYLPGLKCSEVSNPHILQCIEKQGIWGRMCISNFFKNQFLMLKLSRENSFIGSLLPNSWTSVVCCQLLKIHQYEIIFHKDATVQIIPPLW